MRLAAFTEDRFLANVLFNCNESSDTGLGASATRGRPGFETRLKLRRFTHFPSVGAPVAQSLNACVVIELSSRPARELPPFHAKQHEHLLQRAPQQTLQNAHQPS